MNKPVAKLEPEAEVTLSDPLALLRKPFAAHHISQLPKETKKQREEREADRSKGIKCQICGGWHHRDAIHLDYVGHAALTDRLLDTDPMWSWEPLALRDGLPAFDPSGGLWIKLTVCSVSRLGYGHAAGKPGMDPGAREKEVIGDALRNAAMRFGAALDLWHKGDLHPEDGGGQDAPSEPVSGEVTVTSARLTAFEANRQGIGEGIKKFIDGATAKELDLWEKNFDRNTAHVPLAWLESIRDRIELRREELEGEASVTEDEAALDAAFQGTVGDSGTGGMARGDGHGTEAAA